MADDTTNIEDEVLAKLEALQRYDLNIDCEMIDYNKGRYIMYNDIKDIIDYIKKYKET